MLSNHWGEIAGLAGAFVGAVEGMFVKVLGQQLPSLVINAARCTVAAAVAFCILLIAQGGPQFQATGIVVLVLSVILPIVIGDTAYFVAVHRTGVGIATTIAKTYPAFTVLLAFFLLHEQVSFSQLVGIAMAMWGTALLSTRGAAAVAQGEVLAASYRRGIMLAVCAALAWSLGAVALRHSLHTWSVWDTNFSRMALGAIFLWPLALRRDAAPTLRRLTGVRVALGLLGLGLCLSLATLLLIIALSRTSAGIAAACNSMAPLFAVPMSAVLFGERITPRLLVGVAIAIVGIVLITTSPAWVWLPQAFNLSLSR